jgi:regulator of sigma E protease
MDFLTLPNILNFAKDLIVFFLSLSVLVLIHEFGHFIMAKRAGIKVEEFGLGFPPKVFSRKKGETVYSLNAIPIGGFVKLYGEDEEVTKDIHRAYYHKSKLTRASILVAGVLMNFILGVIIFAVISFFSGVVQPSGQIRITAVAPNSPASQANLKVDDIIISVDGESVHQSKQFVDLIAQNKGKETTLTVSRGKDDKFNAVVTPRETPPQGEGALGVGFLDTEVIIPPMPQRLTLSIKDGFDQAIFWIKVTVGGITDAVNTAIHGKKPEGLAGPIGIFQITGVAAKSGILTLLGFIGVLSVNLAVLNIMPFPALDGGRLLFVIVETLFGKRVLSAYEKYAHLVGMIILLTLMALITLGDVGRLLSGVSIIPQ